MISKNMSILAILLISLASIAAADVSYPVQELGNCGSQAECKTYCDQSQNIEACLNFGEKAGIFSQAEAEQARKVLSYIAAGTTPGGCRSASECDNYCQEDSHLKECVDFGVKIGEISVEEAQTVMQTGGRGPGGCRGRAACDEFCNKEENFAQCVDFAAEHGLMDKKDVEMAKKTGGKSPGNCRSKDACDKYCAMDEHFAECINFGVQAGFVDSQDAEIVLAAGGTSQEKVDAWCNLSSENYAKCEAMWVKKGYMTQAEIDKNNVYKNTPRPGGCKSVEECSAYCSDNNEAHLRECWSYELAVGQMTQEQYNSEVSRLDEAHRQEAEGRAEAERLMQESAEQERLHQIESQQTLDALHAQQEAQAIIDANVANQRAQEAQQSQPV